MHIPHRDIFLNHIAQTSPSPLGLEIERAEGTYIYDTNGRKYLDFISGIAVSNVGHQHPLIKKAIIEQLDKYTHIHVYGETIQSPQTQYAQLITSILPSSLNCIYFVNSGTEGIEGAMKLAKAYTQRSEIISFENAYHGSTQGALSIMGNEFFKTKFRPLIPGNKIIKWNDWNALDEISTHTAAVFVEAIRAEAGVLIPSVEYMQALRKKCNDTHTLLVLDEIQTGFGRTGKMFAFEHFEIVPDILVLGKSMGGGLPIGAFITDKHIMQTFTHHPLGHLTTFGGNAICVASALAALKIILNEKLYLKAIDIEKTIKEKLIHNQINELRIIGAMGAIQFNDHHTATYIMEQCLKKGLITDWFLFAPHCLRIAPPLNISIEELSQGIQIILECLDNE